MFWCSRKKVYFRHTEMYFSSTSRLKDLAAVGNVFLLRRWCSCWQGDAEMLWMAKRWVIDMRFVGIVLLLLQGDAVCWQGGANWSV